MDNKNFILELNRSNGEFQGYLKNVSVFYYKITPTNSKDDAKTYKTIDKANEDNELIKFMSHGELVCKVIQL